MVLDIELQLRGSLAYRLLTAAARNGEEPVALLARSVERMIERGRLDTVENNLPPSVLTIKNFWLADAIISNKE